MPPRPPATDKPGLILYLVMRGWRFADIARLLCLPASTVRYHADAEIRRRAATIRAGWDEETRRRRQAAASGLPLIWRRMASAVELGLEWDRERCE